MVRNPKPESDDFVEPEIEVAPEPDAPKLPSIDQESMDVAADRREEWDDDHEEPGVYYLGVVSERRISSEDFANAGVADQDGAVWTRDGGNRLPKEDFSKEARQLLSSTGEFRIVD